MKSVFRPCELMLTGCLMLPVVLGAAETEVAPPGMVVNHAIPPPEVRFVARFSSASSETVIWEDGSVPVPAMNEGRGRDYVVRLAAWRMDRPAASFTFPGKARKMRGHRSGRTLAYNLPPPGYQIRVDEHSTPFGEWVEVQVPWANYVDNPSQWGPGWYRNSAEYRVIGSSALRGLKVRWVEAFFPGDQTALQTTMREWVIDGPQSPVYALAPSINSYVEVRGLEVEYPEITLAVDANRDGAIKLATEDASDVTTAPSPYRFWPNDDDDFGDTSGDDIPNPSSSSDGAATTNFEGDGAVDGARDLVDFFPVFLDLKQLLTVLPPSASVKYKLKHEDGALNFVYTKLNRADALKYQTEDKGAIYGPTLNESVANAGTRRISGAGVELSEQFLTGVKDQDWGVILVEGRNATDKPLVLSVEKADGTVIAEVKLELSIRPVEDMFRHANFSAAAGEAIETAPRLNAPNEGPTNGKNLVFLHGYNVNQQQARGWASDIFKKMWWSGSRAKFYAVTWRGADSQHFDAVTLNLHVNDEHAFQTAPAFAQFINNLTGETITCAHSLGNMVVLAALNLPPNTTDPKKGPANISKHFAFDSAVAAEAIDAALPKRPEMSHSEWDSSTPDSDDSNKIPTSLWASEWHELFPDDARGKLTWRNLFSSTNGAIIYNFYSSGEEVLDFNASKPTPTFTGALFTIIGKDSARGELAWYASELLKGRLVTENFLASDYGGWDIGFGYYQIVMNTGDGAGDGSLVRPTREQILAMNISSTQQRTAPLFLSGTSKSIQDQGTDSPESISNLYGPDGGNFAAKHRIKLLADMIPARTVPMGREAILSLGQIGVRNFDLSSADFRDGWPQERLADTTSNTRWLHSDAREIPYRYNHRVFEKWVELGNLKSP